MCFTWHGAVVISLPLSRPSAIIAAGSLCPTNQRGSNAWFPAVRRRIFLIPSASSSPGFFWPRLLLKLAGDDPNRFARWGKDIAAFERSDHENPASKEGIVFVGSSSIRRWDLKQSFPGMPVLNRGFGGSQLADVAYFASRLVIKHQPRLIVLYVGENDLGTRPVAAHL
jgi:hypothetical protein